MGSKKKALKLRIGGVYLRRDGVATEPLEKARISLYGDVYDPAHGEHYHYSRRGLKKASSGTFNADLVKEVTMALVKPTKDSTMEDLLCCVLKELKAAQSNFPPMNSLHEAFSVLNEEVDELWQEVKKKQKLGSKANIERTKRAREEATQVIAMAMRLILDCCEPGGPSYGK